MSDSYVISASRRSIVLALSILAAFGVGAVGALVAAVTQWTPYWERRFGLVGVVAVGVAMWGLTVWLGAGVVRGIRNRHHIVAFRDGVVDIQRFNGRQTTPAIEVLDVTVASTGGGKKLFIHTRDGQRHGPMFSPQSSTWEAEAQVLRARILDRER